MPTARSVASRHELWSENHRWGTTAQVHRGSVTRAHRAGSWFSAASIASVARAEAVTCGCNRMLKTLHVNISVQNISTSWVARYWFLLVFIDFWTPPNWISGGAEFCVGNLTRVTFHQSYLILQTWVGSMVTLSGIIKAFLVPYWLLTPHFVVCLV